MRQRPVRVRNATGAQCSAQLSAQVPDPTRTGQVCLNTPRHRSCGAVSLANRWQMIRGGLPGVRKTASDLHFFVALGDLKLNTGAALQPSADRRDEHLSASSAGARDHFVGPPSSDRTRVTDQLRAEAVARYRQGGTSRAVAAELGIAKSTVLSILQQAGVAVRPRGVRYQGPHGWSARG